MDEQAQTKHPGKETSGLTQAEAEKRMRRDGYNELPSQKKQGALSILLRVLSEPMLLLLIGSGAIYLFMGEIRDALMLLSFVFVVIGITFYQERKTEKTLEALRNLSSPRALVVRDGQQRRIPGREVVAGDVIIIREGDRVPADARVLSCENLSVDESLLTGESVPVRKMSCADDAAPQRPGGDDLPFVYSGSLVVGGRGVALVGAIGVATEMGKIGKSLAEIKEEDTLLHQETKRIVRFVAIIGVALCLLVIVCYTVLRHDIGGGLLAGLTLSMAILPEEFPVVLLIFMTLGAWRISKRKVLTRRSAAIETLGAATVLCTDKTGTLTLNKMELTSLYADGAFYEVSDFASTPLPEQFHSLLEFGMLASQQDPFDPIEKELHKIGNLYLKETEHLHADWRLVKEHPLSRELLALSHVWQAADRDGFSVAAKGAPEAILDLCHADAELKAEILLKVKEMSERGLRILGAARAEYSQSESDLPADQHDYAFEFIGLLGFIDPPRSTAPGAIREAYAAGMRVIVITGDYPGTAQFVAREIGIKDTDRYITGEELAAMDFLELRRRIQTNNIFARVVPEQKLLIVNALKANNEIVTMTGDGVNDAPALKAAHIGIAMGERGTDVAREASALVLLNDDFSSIVAAVRLGRRIYDNLTRAMGYVIAVHIPIAGMSLLPLLFNFPIVLLPAHIAFLELIIDPACSTVFESVKEDSAIMRRPPRNLQQPMFDARTIALNVLQGLGVLIATFFLFVLAVSSGRGEMEARSFAFAALVLSNLMLIMVNVSWDKNLHHILRSANRTLVAVVVGTLLCLLLVLNVPLLADLFHLVPLHADDFALIIPVTFLSVGWFEGLKYHQRKTRAAQ